MSTNHEIPDDQLREDPTFLNARREATMILILWGCCLIYTVIYCYLFGFSSHEPNPSATGPSIGGIVGSLESFNREPGSVTYPFDLGIPDWVFYGVALPWCVCLLLSFVYGLFIFAEDELGDGADDELVEEAPVEEAPKS